jgi:hypothetical protein
MIAGKSDNSAFFYNPADAPFIDSTSVSMSANVYGIEFIKLKNGAGPGQDMSSIRANISPQIIAGTITIKKAPKLKLLYGSLLRSKESFRFARDNKTYYDVIPGAPGDEYYKGVVEEDYSSYEYWVGLAAGYKVHKNISVGLGLYGAYMGIESHFKLDANTDALDNNLQPYTASFDIYQNKHFDHLAIIAKPSIAAKWGPVSIGIAATLPSLKVWGSGRISQSVESYNLNIHAKDTTANFYKYSSLLISDEQRNLNTTYKSPASIAFGVGVQKPTWNLSLALEYFFPIANYEMMRGVDQTYVRPTTAYSYVNIKDFMVVRSVSYAVLNVGIGAEVSTGKHINILGGLRTDFNNKIPLFANNPVGPPTLLNASFWHYVHGSLGITYKRANSRFHFGVDYAYGFSNYYKGIANLTEASQYSLLQGPTSYTMITRTHSINLLIGFTQYLGKFVDLFKKKRSDT